MSFTDGVGTTAVLLNTGFINFYETFFYDETTETVNGEADVYRSYTVGYDLTLTSDLGNTISWGKEFGVVIPSHRTESCIPPDTGTLSIIMEHENSALLTDATSSSGG